MAEEYQLLLDLAGALAALRRQSAAAGNSCVIMRMADSTFCNPFTSTNTPQSRCTTLGRNFQAVTSPGQSVGVIDFVKCDGNQKSDVAGHGQ